MTRMLAFLCLLAVSYGTAWAETPAASKAEQTPADQAQKEALPDAMQHMVKAPAIDFENLRDPFQSYLAMLAERGRSIMREKLAHLANRKREPLESFDLSTLKLVAIFTKGDERVAMIQDASGKGYIVRPGNYIGTNNGRIEKISDDSIYIVEQILNPAGDITDHQVTLTLKEVNTNT